MDRMGDVVKKNQNAEKEFEARLLRDQLKKDAEAAERDRKKKELARKRDIDVLAALDE
jgi:hypothetical protein